MIVTVTTNNGVTELLKFLPSPYIMIIIYGSFSKKKKITQILYFFEYIKIIINNLIFTVKLLLYIIII